MFGLFGRRVVQDMPEPELEPEPAPVPEAEIRHDGPHILIRSKWKSIDPRDQKKAEKALDAAIQKVNADRAKKEARKVRDKYAISQQS